MNHQHELQLQVVKREVQQDAEMQWAKKAREQREIVCCIL